MLGSREPHRKFTQNATAFPPTPAPGSHIFGPPRTGGASAPLRRCRGGHEGLGQQQRSLARIEQELAGRLLLADRVARAC
ncbi:hypothetical protein Pla175_44080 [Pirellulimonas nuda]|uniref:Uncharacterized protein n=1 Tax=Pirellulimonas nuda TaxID=2528009 RepID=A0A518DHN9_9BACT|nr:hypothetical protein Pla175_44080 [Pirellulimonas nuda]